MTVTANIKINVTTSTKGRAEKSEKTRAAPLDHKEGKTRECHPAARAFKEHVMWHGGTPAREDTFLLKIQIKHQTKIKPGLVRET